MMEDGRVMGLKGIAPAGAAATAFLIGMMTMGATTHAVPFTLTQTFDDPTPTLIDFFGGAVAISGDLVLVGAKRDDTNIHGGGVILW